MKFKRRFLPAVSLLLCISPMLLLAPRLHAQDAAASVQASIDFVSWGEDLKGVEVGEANKHVPATALAFRYSEPVRYHGPQVISIYWDPSKTPAPPPPPKEFNGIPIPQTKPAPGTTTPAADSSADGGKIPDEIVKRRVKEPTLAAIVPLIAGASQMTVLLAPGPQNTFKCYVFDDEPTRFPWGKIRLHNYSSNPIGLSLNKGKMVALKYQESMIAPATPDGSVTYELAYPKDGKWKFQENNILHVNPDEQIHFLVLESDSSFFRSSDGSRGGHLQTVTLRRQKPPAAGAPPK
jgi:hypothetical protein